MPNHPPENQSLKTVQVTPDGKYYVSASPTSLSWSKQDNWRMYVILMTVFALPFIFLFIILGDAAAHH